MRTARATTLVALLALVAQSCVTATALEGAAITIKASAPHRVTATVDGVVRYEQTGPMPLTLKAAPGTCLRAGASGVMEACDADQP